MKKILVAAALSLTFATVASAAGSTGSLTVNGTIESSISLTVESAGGTTSNTSTNAATAALGNVSKYGSAPTGFSLSRGASDWTLSSNIGVKVVKANLTSTDYTLTAALGGAALTGTTWKLNGSTLSTTPATIDNAASYGSTESYPWLIVVTDGADAASFDGTVINFAATSN